MSRPLFVFKQTTFEPSIVTYLPSYIELICREMGAVVGQWNHHPDHVDPRIDAKAPVFYDGHLIGMIWRMK